MASILFCLDPLRSLDPYLSITVADALKSLTKSFHTVICTLQHPSASVFSKFDKVMVVHAGRLVYSGPTSLCATYMEEHTSNAYDLSDKTLNPVEFVVRTLVDLPLESDAIYVDMPSVEKLATLARQPQEHSHNRHSLANEEYTYNTGRTSGDWFWDNFDNFWSLLVVQVKREMLQETRRLRYWIACFVRSVFLGCILG
jgi:ABC-type multidrug transport system ATPase subunit